MDVLNDAQRRYCMSKNRGKNTKPEVALRSACWREGLRFRVTGTLPGRPDFFFTKSRVAIFVDGCFWHGCPIHYQAPLTRAAFWESKLKANQARDLRVSSELTEMGWEVIRIWEHSVIKELEVVVRTITNAVRRDGGPG